MKTILTIGITALVAYLGELFFPWWIVMTIAFIMGYLIPKKAAQAFLVGFMAIFLLWLIFALLTNLQQGPLMAERIGSLFGIPNAFLMAIVSAFVGAISAGISAISGYYFKQLFVKGGKTPTRYKI